MSFLRVAILGEIGSKNLGDDLGYLLMRDALIRELRRTGFECDVRCVQPVHFSSLDHGDHDLVVTGCGTLLDASGGAYVERLITTQNQGIATAILGSGLSDPDHIQTTPEGEHMLEDAKGGAISAWIRGEGPDPLWLLGYTPPEKARTKVGINMGYAAYSIEEVDVIWSRIQEVRQALDVKGIETCLVSCWVNDNSWYPEGEAVLQIGCHRDTLKNLHEIRAIVGFRGHLGVAAACYGVNVLPVLFSTKIEDMYRGTKVRYTALDPSNVDWVSTVLYALNLEPDNETAIETAKREVEERIASFADKFAGSFR